MQMHNAPCVYGKVGRVVEFWSRGGRVMELVACDGVFLQKRGVVSGRLIARSCGSAAGQTSRGALPMSFACLQCANLGWRRINGPESV